MVESEIKLRFASAAEARTAVLAAGAQPRRARRLQRDTVLDNAEGLLRAEQSILRVRSEDGGGALTFKGPVRAAAVKEREELETPVDDPAAVLEILGRLGFRVAFRYEKFREEFTLGDTIVAIDETPIGTFVEIEGATASIHAAARTLGRGPADYVLESYRALFVQDCERRGVRPGDMLITPKERE